MMEHAMSKLSIDPSKNSSKSVACEMGGNPWKISSGKKLYQGSTDVALFCSSLPVLPHEKLNSKETEDVVQFTDDLSSSLNEVSIGIGDGKLFCVGPDAVASLLPDDEDVLLSGLMDDFDLKGLPNRLDDLEEYDLFGSGGGMEMEANSQEKLGMGLLKMSLSDGMVANGMIQQPLLNGIGTVAGEHPYGEHPSRTLFVRNINSNVEDSELRTLFEQYGDIRTLYTACKHRGFVMISYYDIRAARNAMRALQNKPLRRRKLDIHFSIPKDNPSDKDINQGTLVVFNLDHSVSNDDLLLIFGAYGEVKEIRETPHKRHHKFIEFFDVRAAEAALKSLNRSDIAGKRIKLEPSRPGGARRSWMLNLNQELEQDESRTFQHQLGSPITNSPPGWVQFHSPFEHTPLHAFSKSPSFGTASPSTNNSLSGLDSRLHPQASNSVKIAPIGKSKGRFSELEHTILSTDSHSAFHQSHSFPDQLPSHFPGTISFNTSTSNGSKVETLSGPQFLWGGPKPSSGQIKSASMSKPSVGNPFPFNGRGNGFPHSGRHGSLLTSTLNHHHYQHLVGSAPSGVPMERHLGFFQESPETVSPFRGMDVGHNDWSFTMNKGNYAAINSGINVSGNVLESTSPNFRMLSSSRVNPVILRNGPYPGPPSTGMDLLTERGRHRQIENSGDSSDVKKQFQLSLEKIISGEDARTTLMIKNIPNKYTSKMLLAAIDEHNKNTYDFLYLPIDFKNKCNVGYAFINMLSPKHIIPFYQAFNGKKWEKFNSEKVASLAYARIQGKTALITHFQNSSLMNEDKRCRPILFEPEGPDQIILEHLVSNNLNIQVRQLNGSSYDIPPGSPNEISLRDMLTDQ